MQLRTFLPQSLKTRLALITVVIFVTSLWLLTYYASGLLRQDMQRELGEQQFLSVSLIADHLDGELIERMRALETIASEVKPSMLSNASLMQALLEQRPLLRLLFNGGIFITDVRGTAIADVPISSGRLGVNYLDRESVSIPLRQGRSVYGRPAMGKMLRAPIFSITVPLRDAQGQVGGALVGTINLGKPTFFDSVVNRRYGASGGYFLIAPQHRLFVTATDKSHVMQPLPAVGVNLFLDRMVQGYEGYGIASDADGVQTLSAAKRIAATGWLLAATLPAKEAFQPIVLMQQRMFLAVTLVTLLAGVFIWWIASWLLRRQLAPVLKVSSALSSASDAQIALPLLSVKREDEIGQLIKEFKRLLQLNAEREAALRESEAFGRAILDAVDAEIAVVDSEGMILAVNEPWRRFARENGADSARPAPSLEVGADYLAVCRVNSGGEDAGAREVGGGIRAVLDGSLAKFSFEYPCHCEQRQRWFSLMVTPLKALVGGGAVIAHTDITERKLALQALGTSERLLRESQSAANIGSYINTLGKGTFESTAVLDRILGITQDYPHTDAGWVDLMHADYRQAMRDALLVSVRDDKPFDAEYRIVRPSDGVERWMHGLGKIVYDDRGKALSLIGTVQDITERKHSEQLVKEQGEWLRRLYEVGQRLNRTLDLNEIYLAINDFMTLVSSNDDFSISAFDPQTQLISCRSYVMSGQALDVSSFPQIPLEDEGKGTQSMVIRSGESLLLNDYQERLKNTRTSYLVHDQTHQIVTNADPADGVVRSAMLVPIKSDEGVTGVIQVMSGRLNAFTTEHLNVLETLALHVASAEKNARLYAQVQAELEERKRAQEALRLSEERYRTAFQTSPDAFSIICLEDGVVLDVNDGFSQLTGWARDEIVGKTSQAIQIWRNPDDRQRLAKVLERDGYCVNFEADFLIKNGDIRTGLMSARLMTLGGVRCALAVTRDISARKAADRQIQTLAFSDVLTGLPNRRLLLDRLQQAIAASVRHGYRCALLLIDLDDFKTLNDTLGHHQGDLLLQQVAQRLGGCMREGDTVARLGGDEFVVMLENLTGDALDAALQAETVAGKIMLALNQTYALERSEQFSTPSIGITLFGGEPEGVDEPLIRADLAMYQAKMAGRNTMRFFDPGMQVEVAARVALEAGLRQAFVHQQFVLHFQAQVRGDHQITGVEALVRWRDPVRGLVSPAEFIPVAEKTGLILPLGHWVMESACRQLAVWARRPETAHLTMAVNVSARQFRQNDFVEEVLATLERTGASADRLKIELTESLLVANVEDVIAKMNALRARGVRFSLDDFGTGYSSLFYLKRMPLDQLKIDQGFVQNILLDPDDAAIAGMVIVLARSLGLEVVAEGVETQAQRDCLVQLGCHAYQGYLFGRPVPIEEFELMAALA